MTTISKSTISYQSNQFKTLPLRIEKPRKTEVCSWDLVYRIYDNETLVLLFTKQDLKEIERFPLFESKDIEGFNDKNGKLLGISLKKCSSIACHLLDCSDSINGQVPMTLHAKYDVDSDVLLVYFVDDRYFRENFKTDLQSSDKRFEFDISLSLNREKRIMAIEFVSASLILSH